MYEPHVIAMNPGEDFKVITSDQTAHNIHPEPDPMTGNIPWNRSQPPGAQPIVQSWKAQEVAIPVKCNIHPWMHGYHVVVKGPYAITDDSGNFTIENVPPGKLHGNLLAGNLRHADAESNRGGRTNGNREFHVQGQIANGCAESCLCPADSAQRSPSSLSE